jgi:hypothetical protein
MLAGQLGGSLRGAQRFRLLTVTCFPASLRGTATKVAAGLASRTTPSLALGSGYPGTIG